jgi:hypothetical protein
MSVVFAGALASRLSSTVRIRASAASRGNDKEPDIAVFIQLGSGNFADLLPIHVPHGHARQLVGRNEFPGRDGRPCLRSTFFGFCHATGKNGSCQQQAERNDQDSHKAYSFHEVNLLFSSTPLLVIILGRLPRPVNTTEKLDKPLKILQKNERKKFFMRVE